MLEHYKKQKETIIEAYGKIVDLDILPIDDIKAEDIIAQQQKLESEQFVLCAAGQMKAGKSTLLNALIFQDEVLPADDTPHTAKITIIEYAKEPSFVATFYNEEEWNELKRMPYENEEGEKIVGGYYTAFLKDEAEKAIGQGIYEAEMIGAMPKKV